MIVCKSIEKHYGSLQVLKGIDLSIAQGEVVSIVGESGAGKTTLLQILGTLEKPDAGSVIIQDTEVFKLSSNKQADFRNAHIGFVFQFHQLLPEFTALENVCLPGWVGKRKDDEVKKKAIELLDYMGLGERMTHKPSQLSGGEQQRVAVARALVNQPSVVFADEPSGNLDSANAAMLHSFFLQLRKDFGQTFVIVTHNAELAGMADRTITMRDGKME